MGNIITTKDKELRLVSLRVGLLSTLRIAILSIRKDATDVEAIVTKDKDSRPVAYAFEYDEETCRWVCDISAGQFQVVGKQKYEVAHKEDGKQFWDGSGWIEVVDATTSGIVPPPDPSGGRYIVSTVNGIAPDTKGNVRIPTVTTIFGPPTPSTAEGHITGDIVIDAKGGAFYKYGGGGNWLEFSPIGSKPTSFASFDTGSVYIGNWGYTSYYLNISEGGQKYINLQGMQVGQRIEMVIRFRVREAVQQTQFVCGNSERFVMRSQTTVFAASVPAGTVIATGTGQTPLAWVRVTAWKLNDTTIHLAVS